MTDHFLDAPLREPHLENNFVYQIKFLNEDLMKQGTNQIIFFAHFD